MAARPLQHRRPAVLALVVAWTLARLVEGSFLKWTLQRGSVPWTSADGEAGVLMTNDTVLVMGGCCSNSAVWLSSDSGVSWTLSSAGAAWPSRYDHGAAAVVGAGAIPKANVLVLGGTGDAGLKNDVWRSEDRGATWQRMTAAAGWSARAHLLVLVLSDHTVVVLGGVAAQGFMPSDVWQSLDQGASWTQQTAGAAWSGRVRTAGVVLADDTMLLMGGMDVVGAVSDAWSSSDRGKTWAQKSFAAEWSARSSHQAVFVHDTVLLLGGYSSKCSGGKCDDVWRSVDAGATWSALPPSVAPWTGRGSFISVVLSDQAVLILGGMLTTPGIKDIWLSAPYPFTSTTTTTTTTSSSTSTTTNITTTTTTSTTSTNTTTTDTTLTTLTSTTSSTTNTSSISTTTNTTTTSTVTETTTNTTTTSTSTSTLSTITTTTLTTTTTSTTTTSTSVTTVWSLKLKDGYISMLTVENDEDGLMPFMGGILGGLGLIIVVLCLLCFACKFCCKSIDSKVSFDDLFGLSQQTLSQPSISNSRNGVRHDSTPLPRSFPPLAEPTASPSKGSGSAFATFYANEMRGFREEQSPFHLPPESPVHGTIIDESSCTLAVDMNIVRAPPQNVAAPQSWQLARRQETWEEQSASGSPQILPSTMLTSHQGNSLDFFAFALDVPSPQPAPAAILDTAAPPLPPPDADPPAYQY